MRHWIRKRKARKRTLRAIVTHIDTEMTHTQTLIKLAKREVMEELQDLKEQVESL